MQIRMNEMQALIDRRDEVVAKLVAIEREPDIKSPTVNIAVRLSDKAVFDEALSLNAEL